MTIEPFQVVVVDDIARFPLHVWRYLSRSIVYGIGNVRDGGQSDALSGESDELISNLTSEDGLCDATGDLVIRWVPLRGEGQDWRALLERWIDGTRTGRRLFLIDVRGPYASAGPDYRLDNAVATLIEGKRPPGDEPGERIPPDEVWLVSSYAVGSRSFKDPAGGEQDLRLPIRSKTAETLNNIARRVERPVPLPEAGATTAPSVARRETDIHVLLTGAGFEMGSSGTVASMGMPSTSVLIEKALDSVGVPHELVVRPGGRRTLPVPRGTPDWSPLRTAAEKPDLDAYWDALLQGLRDLGRREAGESAMKLKVLQAEQHYREAFRQAFLEYDWGYLNQGLDAVELPWDVWLTTNYTRFVDRAMALSKAAVGRASMGRTLGEEGGWRVVWTWNEAHSLLKEDLHEERFETRGRRLLFKLHGDLGHVSTMAIAGHDKDITTPLSGPIESLHSVYVAAERYLTRLIESRLGDGGGLVHWHVVGHSLYDMLLWRKMEEVIQRTGPDRHRIVVVDYRDEEAVAIRDKIEDRLKIAQERRSGSRPATSPVIPHVYRGQNARRWLAFLKREYRRTGIMWDSETGLRLKKV